MKSSMALTAELVARCQRAEPDPGQLSVMIEDVVSHRILGRGPDGYREAIEWLVTAR